MPKQILLVEDSVTVHKVVAITFAREDAVVTAVKSADEALAKAKEIKPDVVLADGNLHGKSGYDLCAALRADPATAAIACLILTGNFTPYDDARGSKAGADGFVVKPFETQAMIDKTNDVITKKRGGVPVAAAAPASMPTMAMAAPVLPVAAPPAPRPAAPPPLVPPKPIAVAAKDDSLEISIEPAAPPPPKPAPPPLVPPAPPAMLKPAPPLVPPKPPAPAPPPKPVSPPAAPQASTMMMEAPKIPAAPPPPVASPKETPQASTMMMEAPKVPAAPPVVSPKETPQASTMMMEAPKVPAKPAPVASPTGRMQVTMPASVPQMPRPSLIPNTATPAAAAPVKHEERPSRPTPRATIMGMPVIAGPGTPLVPPAPAKPAVQAWAPPRTTSTGMKAIDPASLGIEMPKPEPAAPVAPIQKEMSPLVAAVTERATAEVDREILAAGGDPQQLRALSREVIEKIAWEVVPELAEVILKEAAKK